MFVMLATFVMFVERYGVSGSMVDGAFGNE
jgi:hypothetical protein